MNKKVWYWCLGILAVAIIAALIWNATAPETPSDDANGGQMDHSGMDHGSSTDTEDPNLRGYLDEQDAIMATMMTDMENIEHSGNAAIDFLAGMIPHHESAIAMAQSYQKYGGAHEVLAPLAQEIITAQTDEIEQMKGMIERLRSGEAADEAQAKAYLEAYADLMNHSMSHASADSLDAAFAEGMIMHHQMAVDMANAILPHTSDEEVTKLAQTIVETQEKEISDMQDVLNELQKS